MRPTPIHLQAEADFRRLIARHDLPEPDEVEYTHGSVYFRWDEQKLVVAVDLDDPAPHPPLAGYCGSPSAIS
jgi:hypothetical protein